MKWSSSYEDDGEHYWDYNHGFMPKYEPLKPEYEPSYKVDYDPEFKLESQPSHKTDYKLESQPSHKTEYELEYKPSYESIPVYKPTVFETIGSVH